MHPKICTLSYIHKVQVALIPLYEERLFQNNLVRKVTTIFLLTLRGIFENWLRYPAILNAGKAIKLDMESASKMIAASLKQQVDKKGKKVKNPSVLHHEINVTAVERSIPYFGSKTCRPSLSFASILHNFHQTRLKMKKLRQCPMSETVMELLSSVIVVGMRQCQYSASFKGDCHLYTLFCTKCRCAMHHK